MREYLKIVTVTGREVLDSRGNPTVEAEVILADGSVGRGISPSGASTGAFEALELRDKDERRYRGKGVRKAVSYVNTTIAEIICGMDASDLYGIDKAMRTADGTKDKSHLGANAILAVSIAASNAAAASLDLPLYCFLGGRSGTRLPVPLMNILNGGAHAKNNLDFQEFMIVPLAADSFREALRMGTEVYHSLKTVLEEKGLSTAVGDEGGFAPEISDAFEAMDLLMEAVRKTGYAAGKDISFAMDAAASELYQPDSAMYFFPGESQARCESSRAAQPDTVCTQISRSVDEMIAYYEKLVETYPLISIEDPLNEEDWEGWKKITGCLGGRVQLVGDDLFVTNQSRLARGIAEHCANSILIKPNQIGSLSETIEAIKLARRGGYTTIASHRSGETEDTTIADLAVALNTGQIKTGAPCRSERVAKYNRLLRIEEELGAAANYPGREAFSAIPAECLKLRK